MYVLPGSKLHTTGPEPELDKSTPQSRPTSRSTVISYSQLNLPYDAEYYCRWFL